LQEPRKRISPLRLWWFNTKRYFRKAFKVYGTPKSIARGGALGVFVAFTPTIGAQMTISALIALPFRANPVMAAAQAWWTNPVTIPPVFYFEYWLGAKVTGSTVSLGWADFRFDFTSFKEAVEKLGEVYLLMWWGALIVAPILAAISYPIYYKIAEGIGKRREAREAKWKAIISSSTIEDKFPEAASRKPTSARLRTIKDDREAP